MNRIKIGDIVARKSYNKDIIFIVKSKKDVKNILLEGIFERLIADSDISDLELVDKKDFFKEKEKKQYKVMEERSLEERAIKGKILHLDGDKKYSEKSLLYYKKMGIDAIVKNIPERIQPQVVFNLLKMYNPDILVITGHDGMIKRQGSYYDIYNYRNSKYFIATVQEARRFEKETNGNLVIFAGACQSFFEALMGAGANFASSPARILIDVMDPLIVAKKVATTDRFKFIRIDDLEKDLRDGRKGIDGVGAMRQKDIIIAM